MGFDDQIFKNNFRDSRYTFLMLCSMLEGLKRRDTSYGKCIPLEKRVGIALYALGSSAEHRKIANLFGVGKSTVCQIVLEFCSEIWKQMQPQFLPSFPLTREKVQDCVNGFNNLGFPQCLGAIGGCHFEVYPEKDEACDYFNYKGWYSTILLVLLDYRYRFLYGNVGAPGRCNNSGVYEMSRLKQHIENGDVFKDFSKELNGISVPVFIMGDSAFRLSKHLIKPYPFYLERTDVEKNYNYRLWKCCRVVENAFGHFKARFRRLGKGIDNKIKNAKLIIKSCCVLHNFFNETDDEINTKWLTEPSETSFSNDITVVSGENNVGGEQVRRAIAVYLGSNADGAMLADVVPDDEEFLNDS